MTKVVVAVEKNGTESPTNLIRRFTKRVQGSGVLTRVRSLRYHTRDLSAFARKKRALAVIERKAEFANLEKLGKALPAKKKFGRR